MSFQITTKTGEEGDVILRGSPDGTVEFCKWVERKQSDGSYVPDLVGYKFYPNIVMAFEKVARMRVCSYDADNLADLVKGIKQIRADILKEMGTLPPSKEA